MIIWLSYAYYEGLLYAGVRIRFHYVGIPGTVNKISLTSATMICSVANKRLMIELLEDFPDGS